MTEFRQVPVPIKIEQFVMDTTLL